MKLTQRYGTSDAKSDNPYLNARREWDERYGDLITRARNWRLAAFLCAGTALVQTVGMVMLSLRSRTVPYVVAVDAIGRQVSAGVPDEVSPHDDRLKRASLFEWISDLRSVTTDGFAQRKAIDRVYTRVANGSQAATLISDYYRADPPHKRAQSVSVSVDVQSVLPTSETSYQIEWTETIRDLQGQVKSQDRWRGSFGVAISPPNDEKLARVNPLGIYVTTANWARVL